MRIEDVNRLDREEFMATFGHVYESSPSLAAAAWGERPFRDRAELVDAFRTVAARLDGPDLLALLQAHPKLGATTPMTTDSENEQRSAGLTELDHEARARMELANARYFERFGFPFIIAVQGLGPSDVAASLEDRLGHDPAEERTTALVQVQRIAELRLIKVVAL